MLALTIVVVILGLILLMPVGADACFYNEGGLIRIKIGPFGFTVLRLPKDEWGKVKKPKKEKKTKKEKKNKKIEEEKKPEKKKKMTLDFILALVKMGLHALGRFRRRLSIDLLELDLVCGGKDPYSTAMNYGYISCAMGVLLPALDAAVRIRREEIKVNVDFTLVSFKYYAHLIATIQIWEVFGIGFAFLFEFIRFKIKQKKDRTIKERTDKNGKSDQRANERDNDEAQGHGGRKHHSRRTDNIA